jgi:lipopolysaccharide biosynthesis glycosyltransferase
MPYRPALPGVCERAALVLAVDANYIRPASALLRSIHRFRRSREPLKVIVLMQPWSRETVGQLYSAVPSRRLRLEVREARVDLGGLPLMHHLTAAAYLRLLVPALCPELDRALYLDADMIVLRDLDDLLGCDLGGASLAAVRDLGHPYLGRRLAELPASATRIVGLDPRREYFNSGLLVMDLRAWRREGITGQCLELLREHRASIRYLDQDPLNMVFAGRWFQLDQRWNVFPFTELLATGTLRYRGEQVLPRRSLPGLEADAFAIHYVTVLKPWRPGFPPGENLRRFERFAGDLGARRVGNYDVTRELRSGPTGHPVV